MKKEPCLYLALTCLFLSFVPTAHTYDVVDRYKILEDKFKTEEMLRPFGHDFLIDVDLGINKNLLDVIDDGSDIADSSDSSADKLANAESLLQKYKNTEQTVKVRLNLGVPLPTFHLGSLKVVPDLRVNAAAGANIGIRSERLTSELVAEFLGDKVSDEVKEAMKDLDISTIISETSANDDLLAYLATKYPSNTAIQTAASENVGKYKMPAVSSTVSEAPILHTYYKADVKGGLLLNLFYKEFFGYFNLYGMWRRDGRVILSAADVSNDVELSDKIKDNSQTFLMTDFKIGYEYDRYSAFLLLEEIKIARMSDNIDEGGDLIYGTDPLIRMHADAEFGISLLTFVPFVGLHKREGYGLSDGLYAGLDTRASVLGDRLALQIRGMIDREHFTVSPRAKLWFMQLEYSLKMPVRSEVDGVKPSTLHSLDFRMFF